MNQVVFLQIYKIISQHFNVLFVEVLI